MNSNYTKNNKGFTLIEVMVSVSIFAIIMTVGMGALVDLTKSYKESQEKKAIVDKVNFALEGMIREMRVGRYYNNNLSFSGNRPVPQPNTPGSATSATDRIGFNGTPGRGYFTYYIDRGNDGFYRQRFLPNNGLYIAQTPELLIGDYGIKVTDLEIITYGVYPKTSTTGGSQDTKQARAYIKLKAESENDEDLSVLIQTTVTQRVIDQ